MSKTRWMLAGGLLLLILALAAAFGWKYYRWIWGPNVPAYLSNPYVHVPSGSGYADLEKLLIDEGFIDNAASFRWLADRLSFSQGRIRAGRFQVEAGWSNLALIRHLRGGKQAPVRLTLNAVERTSADVAGKAARYIEADSLSILALLTDAAALAEWGYTPQSIPAAMIPNTYEFFWNTSAKGFVERMIKEHGRFWNAERLQKAEALGLSPTEVYTLASIVERETVQNSEKKRMAGVYLNRLRIGMRLQADPTVVFAMGQFDLRRILYEHLEYDSPYNTYLYAGLPPGPISLASITSIDAVLDAEVHDYLYFVAKPDGSGFHAFAESLAGHNANVAKFRVAQSRR